MVPFSEGHDSQTAVALGGKLLVRTTSDARTGGPWTTRSQVRFLAQCQCGYSQVVWRVLAKHDLGSSILPTRTEVPHEFTSPSRDREAKEALPKELQARPFSGRGSRIQGRLGGVLSFTARASRVVPGV